MLIYMKHERHGRMPVYSYEEMKSNMEHGWVEDKEVKVPKVQRETKDVSEDSEEIETPEDAYFKKFGKKPHHKMKLDTIIKKLEE